MVRLVSQYQVTKGRLWGHLFRRSMHVIFLMLFPWFSYRFGGEIALSVGVSWSLLLWLLFALTIICEMIRLRLGWVVFGQRQYEAHQVSAVVWAFLAAIVVLQYAPVYAAYGILFTCAVVDPFMGELRQAHCRAHWVAISGLIVALIIWLIVLNYFDKSLWQALYLAPLMVVCEWPNMRFIDDNALMMLVPLLVLGMAGLG